MRTVGIVAEYNPFHSGHKYHMEKAKELAAADYAIVVMSPDFVQRGEPAVFDKYTRTKMALAAGADLVIELPVCYATGSAEYFAEGAVRMLELLGVTDALCFGSESVSVPSAQARFSSTRPNRQVSAPSGHPAALVHGRETNAAPSIAQFQETARILLEEPLLYRKELQHGLEQGLTFPEARANALKTYQKNIISKASDTAYEEGNSSDPVLLSDLLSSPNNILGVEYCKALQKFNSQITPIAVLREGSGYSASDFGSEFCSAKALRKYIRENPLPVSDATYLKAAETDDGKKTDAERASIEKINIRRTSSNRANESGTNGLWISALSDYVPSETQALFSEACRAPIFPDALLPFLTQKLLFAHSFDEILDISPDLARRIRELRFACIGKSFEEIVDLLKTRQMTQTRIQRALLHLILDIRKREVDAWRAEGTVFYAHVLGFRRTASPLLHNIKKRSTLPLITKAAHAPKILSGDGLQMWEQDVTASHLYRSLATSRYGLPFRTEYEISPVIL